VTVKVSNVCTVLFWKLGFVIIFRVLNIQTEMRYCENPNEDRFRKAKAKKHELAAEDSA